jgi:hypothetical protein
MGIFRRLLINADPDIKIGDSCTIGLVLEMVEIRVYNEYQSKLYV